MKNWLRENRLQIRHTLSSHESRRYFSALMYADDIITSSALRKSLKGQCIDLGCGTMPYRSLTIPLVTQYDSLDAECRVPDLTYTGDVQNMSMIKEGVYDSAICLEVLEHIPDPQKALSEIYRILKKGGKLICSVPHLSRIHEEPHDYWRFTKYGLSLAFERTGFRVISMEPRGGLFCFLGHQVSTLLLCLVWNVPIIQSIGMFLNKWIFVRGLYLLDGFFDSGKIFAAGYTCVAEKE